MHGSVACLSMELDFFFFDGVGEEKMEPAIMSNEDVYLIPGLNLSIGKWEELIPKGFQGVIYSGEVTLTKTEKVKETVREVKDDIVNDKLQITKCTWNIWGWQLNGWWHMQICGIIWLLATVHGVAENWLRSWLSTAHDYR